MRAPLASASALTELNFTSDPKSHCKMQPSTRSSRKSLIVLESTILLASSYCSLKKERIDKTADFVGDGRLFGFCRIDCRWRRLQMDCDLFGKCCGSREPAAKCFHKPVKALAALGLSRRQCGVW